MHDSWRRAQLPSIAAELARKPGHEAVRVQACRLLEEGLGAKPGAITHEFRMPLVGGRADALFGATVFEFKTDLGRELGDVHAKLPSYLAEHERQTGRRPALGITTDGGLWLAHELRDGVLHRLGEHRLNPDRPEELLLWLAPVASEREDLEPTPRTIQAELGRGSLTFRRAAAALAALWRELGGDTETRLKRELWDRLLREVYGEEVGSDALFLQHTYLVIVAKTIAARVFDLPADDAAAILSGAALARLDIHGAVESDFFDWVLHHPDGPRLVGQVARQVARFRLREVRQDVLKALYESLMDPDQRRDLGEYYTPDWLAARLTRRAVADPLGMRVLDPACGSGTFLFQALRHLRAAARGAGWDRARLLRAAMAQVRGLDVHPVAVIIARVTWLLALGEELDDRPCALDVPVFLGDAMQWNIATVADVPEVRLDVPDEPPLRVPAGFAESQDMLEGAVRAVREGIERGEEPALVRRHLLRTGAPAADVDAMAQTYGRILALHKAGRDGIWPYVLRNLTRPLWLSRADQRADVLLGNPPWVAFRHLSAPMQARLRAGSQAMNLWVGRHLATQQDLCALFTLRAAERYLKPGGALAFVLPYAVLNRPAHEGLRRGDGKTVQLRWEEAWSLDETVQPLFPVPACVLLGRRGTAGPLPARVRRLSGGLPRRDADEAQADAALTESWEAWPPIPRLAAASPYRARFRNGATIFPRRFFLAERVAAGRLGASRLRPLLRGKAGKQDKAPWRDLPPPEGPVERPFLKNLILGETLAPFRLLVPALSVLPVLPDGTVMDAAHARREGHAGLAGWLEKAEALWAAHAARGTDGQLRMSLADNLDHMGKLSKQFPLRPLRVAYAKAGTLFAAAVIRDAEAVVDHMAYWAAARSEGEALYLAGLLNSDMLRARIAPMQPKGQGGARHFDNLIWELPIPEHDPKDALHAEIAALAARCEEAAAAVPLAEGQHFTGQRRAIREALRPLSAALDALVARLPGL